MQSFIAFHTHGEKLWPGQVFLKWWISWSHEIWHSDDVSALQIDDSEAISLCCRTMPHYLVDQATVWSKRNTGAGGRDVPTIPYKYGINGVSFDDIFWFIFMWVEFIALEIWSIHYVTRAQHTPEQQTNNETQRTRINKKYKIKFVKGKQKNTEYIFLIVIIRIIK